MVLQLRFYSVPAETGDVVCGLYTPACMPCISVANASANLVVNLAEVEYVMVQTEEKS